MRVFFRKIRRRNSISYPQFFLGCFLRLPARFSALLRRPFPADWKPKIEVGVQTHNRLFEVNPIPQHCKVNHRAAAVTAKARPAARGVVVHFQAFVGVAVEGAKRFSMTVKLNSKAFGQRSGRYQFLDHLRRLFHQLQLPVIPESVSQCPDGSKNAIRYRIFRSWCA